MFGVTQIPSHYRNALSEFEPVFHDDRNRSLFSPFVSALIFAENQWTIAALERGISHRGVARLYNPATGEKEWGNKFVTSCLEVGNIYVMRL